MVTAADVTDATPWKVERAPSWGELLPGFQTSGGVLNTGRNDPADEPSRASKAAPPRLLPRPLPSLSRRPARRARTVIARGRTAAVLLLVLGAVGLRLWRLPAHTGKYGEGVYWQSLRALSEGHTLFDEVFSSQPPVFLLGILPAFDTFGHTLVAARATVLVLSLLALLGIYLAGRGIAGRAAGWIAVALLATAPVFAGQSVALLAEVPALAFALLCLALAVAAGKVQGRRRLVLAAASGGALSLGLLTKLFAVVVAVPALLYLLGWGSASTRPATRGERAAAQPRHDLGRQASILASFGGGLAVVMAAGLAPFLGASAGHVRPGRWFSPHGQVWVRPSPQRQAAGGPGDEGAAGLAGARRAGTRRLAAHAGHRAPGAVGLGLGAGPGAAAAPAAQPPGAADATFRAHCRPRAPGGHQGGRGASRADREDPRTRTRAVAGAVVAVAVLGTGIDVVQAMHASKRSVAADRQMAAALRAATRPGDLVVTDDQYLVATADRDVPPALVDTSRTRFRAGYLTVGQLEQAAVAPGVRAVLLTAPPGSARVPAFRRWIEAHFYLYQSFGHDQALYVRDLDHEPRSR